MKHYFYLFLLPFLFVCCSEKETNSNVIEEKPISSETPAVEWVYGEPLSYDVKWTAFKHSKKVPVYGAFDSVLVTGFKSSSSISESLKGVSFELFTASTNTNDKDRDYKIITHFFGSLMMPLSIKGEILEVSGDESGKGSLSIQMNGITKKQSFKWSIDQNAELFIKSELSVLDWDGKAALDSLNKVCEEKHTGPNDSESVLWPTVEVVVISQLEKTNL
jgi:hypothetical protein